MLIILKLKIWPKIQQTFRDLKNFPNSAILLYQINNQDSKITIDRISPIINNLFF